MFIIYVTPSVDSLTTRNLKVPPKKNTPAYFKSFGFLNSTPCPTSIFLFRTPLLRGDGGREGRGAGDRHRPRDDLLLRGRVAAVAQPCRGHPQRPGQPHHAVLRCLHRHLPSHRRRGHEPGRNELRQHRLR